MHTPEHNTQRALDAALYEPIPCPEVYEWFAMPGDDMRNLLARAEARAVNRMRNDKPLTGYGEFA